MKHTPGPWYVERSLMQRVLSDKGCVCVPHMHDNIGALESSANARLIAAAPDLLAALELVRPIIENPGNRVMGEFAAALSAIDSAIAKATV